MVSEILTGDCVEVMAGMEPNSVDAVVCDPPYGLEFMGKEWDRLGWQAGGGFSKPGIGERQTEWTSHSATSRFGAANPTCAICGGRLRGKKQCSCEQPHDHWKPIGKRRNPENENLPDDMTGGGMGRQLRAMQAWHEQWARAAYRVLKPGGHLLAFGGSRTYHRMACAVEDAGFEIRDQIMWLYGSGFPKSHDVSKAIDKAAGAEREVVGPSAYAGRSRKGNIPVGESDPNNKRLGPSSESVVTTPATDAAREWSGWGTALKPAHEPIVVARKPLIGTVAANVLKHGTGALNVDGCRVGVYGGPARQNKPGAMRRPGTSFECRSWGTTELPTGRWPANVILDEDAGAMLDEQR